MQGRMNVNLSQENPLWISWHDTNWIPILNPTNVMDYFSEKTNPFYDRTCNNEIVKMQRQSLDQLNNMNGIEYILLHVQGPILYVIRKQHRHSPSDVTPIADYYIIAGTVYQAPDLASVFNSRLLSITHHLQGAFEEASSYSRYHPNKGYTWDFSSNKALTEKTKSQTKKETDKVKEEPSSLFQRQRVDLLLNELLQKFPLPMPPQQVQQNVNQPIQSNGTKMEPNESTEISVENIKQEIIENPQSNGGTEIKSEPLTSEMKPPPEKKMK
ncbi:mediator of RNA polymerase II transcription subunit 6 [Bradysia coprophila]|uniref:mediator of RNA polymerase II transcription subunit 6 n=1 Tax=Bradysia coprophila TaxID=38358 RepID=UPI00187D7275|nr:mediator of RNA polymerase II transcription subunit 6 [Bradysia coprophila]XP_037026976.1 mediator of RNA polymerase II transcription subunit 6 [Bradysia coprophila]